MFDLKNVHKQLFKNNMAQEKNEKIYKENPILWNNADPNYRNKVKRSFIKIKLVTLFDDKYSEEFLEKTSTV